jgi:hypothetical protein
MATEYIGGTAMVVTWTSAAGATFSLAAEERSVAWTPSVEIVDATAGSDTTRKRITSFKDATATVNWVDQTNGAGTASALDAGAFGTLTIGPEGTATGKRKITFPCISQGAKYSWPFDNVAEVTCDFIANGAYTDATY